MLDIIEKTRDGHPLTPDDIQRLVAGIVDGTWPDYQLTAWLMAVVLRGLSDQETFWLTGQMAFSHGNPQPLGLVDKHSTGGVGDKTTLVLAPLIAALGIPIAKMSGRGLGHTGGTLDKLESIPGFQVGLTLDDIRRQVDELGLAVVAQSHELAPADRRLYALRDVSGTVGAVPLIASSIMSKKLAAGTPNLVLDVKVGSGAFMPSVEPALELAKMMVNIGRYYGRRVTALLTTMQQPLGWAVGNAIEVNEAVDCLEGRGPEDLRDEAVRLAGELVHLVRGISVTEGIEEATACLVNGQALEKFWQWVARQGGSVAAVANRLPLAPVHRTFCAPADIQIGAIDTAAIGRVALDLGAGRHQLGDPVNPAVGLRCYAKLGRQFARGEVVADVYAMTAEDAETAVHGLERAFQWGNPASIPPLVLAQISSETDETRDGDSGV